MSNKVLLLTAAQVAEILAISVRHVHKLNREEKIPAPVRLGRSVRWSRNEIKAWIAAGSPDREEWEQRYRKR